MSRLHYLIDTGPLKNLSDKQYEALRSALEAAEQTGLHPKQFGDQALVHYLLPALRASERGQAFAFVAVAVIALLGAALGARLVRRPVGGLNPEETGVTPGP